jgi:hypothetical protein
MINGMSGEASPAVRKLLEPPDATARLTSLGQCKQWGYKSRGFDGYRGLDGGLSRPARSFKTLLTMFRVTELGE